MRRLAPKIGPLSVDELVELWATIVDPGYARTLQEAGDGEGLEVIGQLAAQLSRASVAIDFTTQAMYILPWSGQSGPPAAGEQHALVELVLARALRLNEPLTVGAGQVFFEELTSDWGDNPGDSGQPVLTGRRYTLLQDFTFAPGQMGPTSLLAVSERVGSGYNNPLPGTITHVDQVGSGFNNVAGAVTSSPLDDRLVCDDTPDVIVPDHVGQYVLFTAGANAGKAKRVSGYGPPDLAATLPVGGVAVLERTVVLEGTIAGTPAIGEIFEQATSGAVGHLTAYTTGAPHRTVLVQQGSVPFDATHVLTGVQSGATMTPTKVALSPAVALESNTAEWRVMDWSADFGLTATNPERPEGGRVGMLDGLGKDRNIFRAPNELDDQFRPRVATLADVVSPNAIVRAANRVLAPFGVTPCFREAGQQLLPGLYYDAATAAGDDANAYDLDSVLFQPVSAFGQFQEGEVVTQVDPTSGAIARGRALCDSAAAAAGAPVPTSAFLGATRVTGQFQPGVAVVGAASGASYVPALVSTGMRPQDRHKWVFNYLEMRAFFLIGVPTLDLGDTGMAYDAGVTNAYDASPFPAFYDGFAVTAANVYRALYQDIDVKRAGGVGFDLEIEDLGCV